MGILSWRTQHNHKNSYTKEQEGPNQREMGEARGEGAARIVGPVVSCLLFVSTAFPGTRRAAPHLLPLPRASSACGGGRPSGERAALV